MSAAVVIHRKRQLARERQMVHLESKRRVDAWFSAFDKNRSGVLERHEMKELLQYLSPDRTLDEKFIDLLMSQAVAIDTTGDGQNDTKGISKASLEVVIDKYNSYIDQQGVLDAIFDEFDANKSGVLEPNQLVGLLQKVSPNHPVTEGDVQHVLDQCDKSGDGSINRSEALAACATWKNMVSRNATDSQAGCCVIV
mmetsp:Transcript_51866/g.116452  ORF Transcript_51866/g.116452 Transcript_51866/m.116452 type:complete len:196 (-) Transcript_51866:142-729(-)